MIYADLIISVIKSVIILAFFFKLAGESKKINIARGISFFVRLRCADACIYNRNIMGATADSCSCDYAYRRICLRSKAIYILFACGDFAFYESAFGDSNTESA